jgi:hypothetical protein
MSDKNDMKSLTFNRSKRFKLDKEFQVSEIYAVNNTDYPVDIEFGKNLILGIDSHDTIAVDSLNFICKGGYINIDNENKSLNTGHNVRLNLLGRKVKVNEE